MRHTPPSLHKEPTFNVKVAEAVFQFAEPGTDAVRTATPGETKSTTPVDELIVAADVLLLEYEMTPASVVLIVGAVIVKSGSSARYGPPGAAKPVRTGVALVTVRVAVWLLEMKLPYADLVAVITVEPAFKMVTWPVY